MSYMALYRKWRPDTFSEVKGQEHIVTTLSNQLVHDRIGHAYLFCGTRGTGKTTIAKLFAKAVNCEHPLADGSPCNCCSMCQSISQGNAMNVIEIDAASNNGVDNIREIRDEVQYTPTEGKYKVYIIDEVHMLSIGAFNALLKTLEEPPSYVIFILATTEAHKIPITILSRCQKYDFHRISVETIADRLADLLKREEISYEDKAVTYIARAADGSMRDGLSLLDQCISFLLGETLTYDKVLEILGAVDIEVFDEMLGDIWKADIISAIDLLDRLMWQGRDLTQFVTDFIWYLRNLLLVKSDEAGIDKVDVSSEYKELMLARAKEIPVETLMRYIRVLSETASSMRNATQKRVILEIAIMKLGKPQTQTGYEDILDRLRQLEEKIDAGAIVSTQAAVDSRKNGVQPLAAESVQEFDIETALNRKLPPADAAKVKEISANWSAIKAKVGAPMNLYLRDAQLNLGEDGQSLVLMYPAQDLYGYMYFSKEENRKQLEIAVEEVTAYHVPFQCRYRTETTVQTNIYNYNLAKLNIDIDYED